MEELEVRVLARQIRETLSTSIGPIPPGEAMDNMTLRVPIVMKGFNILRCRDDIRIDTHCARCPTRVELAEAYVVGSTVSG